MKKGNKFFGYFTSEKFQSALRNPSRATITEAVFSAAVIFGIEFLAAASWSGICWIWKNWIMPKYRKFEYRLVENEAKKLRRKRAA